MCKATASLSNKTKLSKVLEHDNVSFISSEYFLASKQNSEMNTIHDVHAACVGLLAVLNNFGLSSISVAVYSRVLNKTCGCKFYEFQDGNLELAYVRNLIKSALLKAGTDPTIEKKVSESQKKIIEQEVR
jgi:hypothetical protein